MKKIIALIAIISLIVSCSPVRTTTSGLENTAFVELYGARKYNDTELKVVIDNNEPIYAKVNMNNKSMKPYRYKIPTGKHEIHIFLMEKEIYTETIFTSSQITKKITLP